MHIITHRTAIGLALVTAACSADSPEPKLPSATFAPHLEAQATSVACGQEIAFYGNATPDLRYAFVYDAAGRMTQANGVWLADGETETSSYTYSGDKLASISSTSSYGAQASLLVTYDASDNLVGYDWSASAPGYQDAWTYVFSNFIAPHQPAREVITQAGQPALGYDLVYDVHGRLIEAIPDSGPSTTWTYDDQALTITVDTGNGAVVGVMTFAADGRPLTTAWTGTDPDMIDGDETWSWTGDQLDSITYRSGSPQAPQQLEVVQVDTMLYNCPAARQLTRTRPLRFKAPITR